MLSRLVSDLEPLFTTATPEEASGVFWTVLSREGASYLQTRLYRRPSCPLTPESHYAAGGLVARVAPATWPGSEAFNYICFACNPLIAAVREQRTTYRFSDFAPHGNPSYGAYWEALGEADIGEAVCATSYGAGGAVASLHLGFDTRDIGHEQRSHIHLVGLLLTETLMRFGPGQPADRPPELTPRERDVLAYVAAGKTDWEISRIIGVSEATTRFHVDNGRRKLNAVTRAQAVAKLALLRMI